MPRLSAVKPEHSSTSPWSRTARITVSLLIVWHLAAVLIGPLSVPQSIHGSAAIPAFLPYHRIFNVGHAYKFFAPDPGPSHLIEYDLVRSDGSHITGKLPDRNVHWPRLLYHRHFMLTEFVGNMPPDMTVDLAGREWEQLPISTMQRTRVNGYAQHLLHKHDAVRATLTLVQHGMPSMEQIVQERAPLSDERSYRRRPLGVYERDQP